MNLDQLKGIIQVVVPTLVASFGSQYIPADTVTSFDNSLVVVIVTVLSALWSAKTTKTK